jgi:hypothetical protein
VLVPAGSLYVEPLGAHILPHRQLTSNTAAEARKQ